MLQSWLVLIFYFALQSLLRLFGRGERLPVIQP